jgi:hypothetical protein
MLVGRIINTWLISIEQKKLNEDTKIGKTEVLIKYLCMPCRH